MTDLQRRRDNNVLHLLSDRRGRSARTLAEHFGVSDARISQQLRRLLLAKVVTRKRDDSPFKRGRTSYLYSISRQGLNALVQAAEEQAASSRPRQWLIWG